MVLLVGLRLCVLLRLLGLLVLLLVVHRLFFLQGRGERTVTKWRGGGSTCVPRLPFLFGYVRGAIDRDYIGRASSPFAVGVVNERRFILYV